MKILFSGTFSDTNSVRIIVRFSGCSAVFGKDRGGPHGAFDHFIWRTCLLRRRRLEKQTELVPEI